ncbi:MAG: TonB family protein [Lysobacteraceae bacterium]
MSADAVALLAEGALATSAAILIVLALRKYVSRAFGAACLPLLWALVPMAQIAVLLPAPAPEAEIAWRPVWASAAPAVVDAPVAVSAGVEVGTVLLIAWALGAALAALGFARAQWRFRRRLGVLRLHAPGVWLAQGREAGPAVIGLLRPRIVLPSDFFDRYGPEQQALILAHERSHLRRGDVPATALATVLRCLYWFNPLIHYAASRLRHDQELASDAEVAGRHPHLRRCYAATLLDVQLAVPGLPVGCLWQSSHPLKERILMLSKVHPSTLRRSVGLGLVAGLALGVSLAVWAAQPAASAQPRPAASAVADVADSEVVLEHFAPPKYPAAALEARQSGHVLLLIEIDPQGRPGHKEVLHAELPGVFDAAAMAAVDGWRFTPARRDGQAVAQRVKVPVCFSLDETTPMAPCNAEDGIPEAALDAVRRAVAERDS